MPTRRRSVSTKSRRRTTYQSRSRRVYRNAPRYRGGPLAVNVTIGNIGNSAVTPCPRLAELPQHDVLPYVAGRLKDMELELQSIYEGLDKGNVKLEKEIAGLAGVRDKMSEASTEISSMAALAQRASLASRQMPATPASSAGPNGEPRYP